MVQQDWRTGPALMGGGPTLAPRPRRVPAIDFEGLGGIDLDRLERGLQLLAERVGEGRYHVTGGSSDHWVDLYSTSHPRCDCGDHLWREQLCKHILAGLLHEGNDRVVAAVARLFARLRESIPRAA